MSLNSREINALQSEFIEYLNQIQGERGHLLREFYSTNLQILRISPAASKASFHGCYEGGYLNHIVNVVKNALNIAILWEEAGSDSGITIEEIIFSALNHDLGKLGELTEGTNIIGKPNYLPNPSEWHRKNQGTLYITNPQINYMTVPDRSLWTLNQLGVKMSFAEMISIKLHDGLYQKENENYLIQYSSEAKPRTSLVYILHQADLMAARIEFEKEWLVPFQTEKTPEPIKSYQPFKLKV